MSAAEIDELYGLEPVIGEEPGDVDPASRPAFVVVACPYCGERFETSADASAGPEFFPNSRMFDRGCLNCHSQIHGSNHPAGMRFLR